MNQRPLTDLLCSASARGNLAEVIMHLQNGAHVDGCNVFGRTPLQVVKLGCPAVASHLLLSGADPDRRDPVLGLTVAHDAARYGYLDMVEVLVNRGANVDIVDFHGNLPLHLAAKEGHTGVVRLLIECTAHPGRRNVEGRTAFDLALEGGKTDTANLIRLLTNE